TVGALSFSGARLDLNEFSSVEELEALGGDRLKSALKAIGVKCGGYSCPFIVRTVKERAARLMSIKGKDVIPTSLLTKDQRMDSRTRENEPPEIAWVEAQIYELCEQLGDHRVATIENIHRKQAQSNAVEDLSDHEEVVDDDDDCEPEVGLYNPKNVPLGWDGKPIPYWLYKLHGLNLSYTCEICGNYVYKGPKAFQMHFAVCGVVILQEWRHAHGMRCLGIPNSSHFANVTKINEAVERTIRFSIAVWGKIQLKKDKDRWKAEIEEEFEDSMGNVVTRKTYEDLKKQGLL
ncbi:splicing factor 3A subunit 3-like, partial [Octopus sinensis]|uniref:Splicing factor 3A subunit 3-like n=1 Tax=Octopus sinensis TaxID=2607531 RepID=A0A7E6EIZ0_9MOLL